MMFPPCPSCGTEHHVDAYAAQAEQADFLRALLDVPNGLSTRVMRYLAVFKPQKRKLAAWRAADLTRELAALMNAKTVAFDGAEHRISAHGWHAGLGVMQEQLAAGLLTNLPMKNHNYLIQVAITNSREPRSVMRASNDAPQSKLQGQVNQAVEDFISDL